MTGESVAASSRMRVRALNHVDARTVVLQKIEVDGDEIGEWMSEIADDGNGLQKYFWHDYRRSGVDEYPAIMQACDERAEQAEIAMRGFAQGGAVCQGVRMRRVGADGDVHSHRHVGRIRLVQNARRREFGPGGVLETPAISFSGAEIRRQGAVHFLARFPRRPKAAVRQHRFDILAGVSGERDLKVMNGGGAIHCKGCDEAAAHKIDQDRRQAAFDNVPSQRPHNGLALRASVEHRVYNRAE